ncbi:MAG: hypothetical protein K0S53_1733 [Bacteroidetes bacterium]|jgi:hypothetical protein|nr:hypothetical protein [Bacteroidota bacterium]MDF2450829.1 hypothetical protein [Bacteroidota bacterium]
MKQNHHKYIILFILVIIGFFFHFKTLNDFPQYKHSWAQNDRYALALGFINNGGDFFHPETFVYNKQFPDDFRKVKDNTITSVDFPVHDYAVSVIMRIFNTTEPWCFRLYILLYSMVGLYFLYKLTALFTDSLFKSVAVVLFAASSPVLLYYQNGFLPTIPSLANCMIALFFLFRYYRDKHRRDYFFAFLFLTLAVLARLPFAILLVAIASMEMLLFLKNKRTDPYKWLTIFISIGIIGGYYLYNNHLRAQYGSIFLNHILPATTVTDLVDYFLTSTERWGYVYFSPIHYILFLVACVYFIIHLIFKKSHLSGLTKKLLMLSAVLLFGCVLYYLLMTFQYLSHDYYFLDTFYLPIICLFLFFVIQVPSPINKKLTLVMRYTSVLIFIPVFIYSFGSLKSHQLTFTNERTTAENFNDAGSFLDSLKIPESAKILVMGPDGPNNPFVFMKRKGYAAIFAYDERIVEALKWPFDYVVLENSKLINAIYPSYPDICKQLSKVATNGKITVFVRGSKNDRVDLDDFFSLTLMDIKLRKQLVLDSVREGFLGIESASNPFSDKKSGIVRADMDYGLSFKSNNVFCLNDGASVLKIKSHFGSDAPLNECLICVSIDCKGKNILFLANDLKNLIKTGTWDEQEVLFNLPRIEEKEFEFSVFIWNKGKNTLYYEDFGFFIYQ